MGDVVYLKPKAARTSDPLNRRWIRVLAGVIVFSPVIMGAAMGIAFTPAENEAQAQIEAQR